MVAGDLEALERVAYEFVEDQAIQGVLYTETRYNPHYLTGDTLSPEQVRFNLFFFFSFPIEKSKQNLLVSTRILGHSSN